MSLTDEQKLFLASSPEFDEVLQKDPVLADLDACRIDYERERDLLHEVFHGTWTVAGGVPVAPITPAVWAVLWAMKSPFVTRGKTAVRVIDVAVFLYLLAHGVSSLNFSTLEEDAKKEGAAYGLPEDAEAVAGELADLVEVALAPLRMLPEGRDVYDDEVVFDSDWLLSVCSVAARESGITLEKAMTDLPLSVVFGLLVVRARKSTPDKHYSKRSPEWVSKKELERVNELSEDFVKQHFKPSAGASADIND